MIEHKAGGILDNTVMRGGHKSKSHDASLIPEGITASDSSRWQTIAQIPQDELVTRGQAAGEIATSKDGGRPSRKKPPDSGGITTLSDLGIAFQRLAEWRLLASLPREARNTPACRAGDRPRPYGSDPPGIGAPGATCAPPGGDAPRVRDEVEC